MDHLHDLVEEASTITSSMTGVDYNDDYDHKYDYAMPSLLDLILNSSPGHLQTKFPYLAMMTRQSQGVAEMLQYPIMVVSMYVRLYQRDRHQLHHTTTSIQIT